MREQFALGSTCQKREQVKSDRDGLKRTGFAPGSGLGEGVFDMSRTRNKYAPQIRDRAMRMTGEHRADYGSVMEAMSPVEVSVAAWIGRTAEVLRRGRARDAPG